MCIRSRETRAELRGGGRRGGVALAWLVTAALVGCRGEGGGAGLLAGAVEIDGSSTVFPVTEAVAEEFQAGNPDVRVTVGLSGTGGGFKRFCGGETDVSNASRPITDAERGQCGQAGIEFVELPVAWDGLSVVVNPSNAFVQCLAVEELKRIWEPESRVRTWRDVRSEWSAEEIKLYGPGTDSGTFDYFTEVVVGEARRSRPDYQASEDDNVLVQGVAGDRYALGYFGYAYYAENTDILKLAAVDGGQGCVLPSTETISSGTYAHLSRPLFIYVKRGALERPEVRAFVQFYMEQAPSLVPATGYLPLGSEQYRENLARVAAAAPASR
ncbi:MAG: PstS family phosphate ABC transporter substrate-binding protein [Gemmatimonadetes bacterium]|nr:PstS family phosphate ABC transporter substrate-binding protein [Gemmatimonadota bacterium]